MVQACNGFSPESRTEENPTSELGHTNSMIVTLPVTDRDEVCLCPDSPFALWERH